MLQDAALLEATERGLRDVEQGRTAALEDVKRRLLPMVARGDASRPTRRGEGDV